VVPQQLQSSAASPASHIMRTVRRFATLFSIYGHIFSVNALIHCDKVGYSLHPAPTLVADCYAALKMIPDGTIVFDGIDRKPLHLHLPLNAREPKLSTPAMYRSGNCAIYIVPEEYQLGGPWDQNHATHLKIPQPRKAASVLYYQLFPLAKKLVPSVIETCLPEERTRFNGGTALVEMFSEHNQQHLGTYRVEVRRHYPGPIGQVLFDTSMNVYEADESGKVGKEYYEKPY
jgi:hypothetical protein